VFRAQPRRRVVRRLRLHPAYILVSSPIPRHFQGGALVASLLNESVQNLSFVIDCTPHEHAFTVDTNDHFIKVPDRIRARARAPNIGCNGPPELIHPALNRLVGNVDAALRKKNLHIPQTESEAEYSQTSGRMTSGGKRWRLKNKFCIRGRYISIALKYQLN
jgi:hypothetical protein